MLAPSLATMLCVLTTDAVAEPAALDQALRRASRPHVRPARHRRLLFHQRHRAVAGIGRQRDRPAAGRSRRRGAAGLRRPVRAAASRRRGRHQARHRDRDRGRLRGAGAVRRPGDRARQPGQDRAVRVGSQLGPGARGRRPGARGHPRTRSNRRVVQRFSGVHRRQWGRRARATWTCLGPTSPSPSTSASATVKPPSGPPTCRTPTSKRIRPTAHDHQRRGAAHPGQGARYWPKPCPGSSSCTARSSSSNTAATP